MLAPRSNDAVIGDVNFLWSILPKFLSLVFYAKLRQRLQDKQQAGKDEATSISMEWENFLQ